MPYISKGRGVGGYGQRYLGTSFYRTNPCASLRVPVGREAHHPLSRLLLRIVTARGYTWLRVA
jgi:hypothetical protein